MTRTRLVTQGNGTIFKSIRFLFVRGMFIVSHGEFHQRTIELKFSRRRAVPTNLEALLTINFINQAHKNTVC